MASSEQDDTVFPEEDLDDDDDELSEDDDDDEDEIEIENDDVINSASPSTSSPAADAVTVAVPASSVPNGGLVISTSAIATTMAIVTSSSTPSPIRHRIEVEEKKPQPQPIDDSRRLFQRLWTDEDEIELLQGFLDYTTSRGSTHHNDTALFYDQIKSKLQLDFNKNQLVEKLRRLKKKYRNVLGKITAGKDFSFKSPHDQATFEISRKIWSNAENATGRLAVDDSVFDDEDPNLKNPNFTDEIVEKKPNLTPKSRKRPRSATRSEEKRIPSQTDNKTNGNDNTNASNLGGMIEETVRSCLSPLFKELLSNAMGVGGRGIGIGFGGLGMNAMAMNAMPLSFGGGEGSATDERWRKQQILELEVYAKRLELVQDQIRAALEELRSTGR
jgi:hypothetical protein